MDAYLKLVSAFSICVFSIKYGTLFVARLIKIPVNLQEEYDRKICRLSVPSNPQNGLHSTSLVCIGVLNFFFIIFSFLFKKYIQKKSTAFALTSSLVYSHFTTLFLKSQKIQLYMILHM